jgi:SAM-dependent methyltransferase
MNNKNPDIVLNTILHTIVLDMNNDFKENIEMIVCKFPSQYDVIVCNLAIHYFLESISSMRNYINFCCQALRKGGVVIITCLSGQKIFDKIGDGSYDLVENEILKFSIKKLYNNTKLEPAGQRIDVLLPFSDSKYYTEFLTNINVLRTEFEDRSFVLESEITFANLLPRFEQSNKDLFDKLSSNDIEYINLFTSLIFRKTT